MASPYALANRACVRAPLFGAVDNVGAGLKLQVRVPAGATYNAIMLRCKVGTALATKAQLKAHFKDLRITLSGYEQFSVDADELIDLIEYQRPLLIGDSGHFFIPFERLWMQGLASQLDANWGSQGEKSFIINIDQDAAGAIDSIEAFASIYPVAEPIGKRVIIRRFEIPFTSTGKKQWSDLPLTPGEALFALHIKVPDLTKVISASFIVDTIRQWDTIPPDLMVQFTKEANPNRAAQTNWYHMDFASRGLDSDVLPIGLARQSTLEIDFSANPTSFVILAEYGIGSDRQTASGETIPLPGAG